MFGPLSTLATDYTLSKGEINGENFHHYCHNFVLLHAVLRFSFFILALDDIKIIIFINYKQLSLHDVLRVNSLPIASFIHRLPLPL